MQLNTSQAMWMDYSSLHTSKQLHKIYNHKIRPSLQKAKKNLLKIFKKSWKKLAETTKTQQSKIVKWWTQWPTLAETEKKILELE